MSKREAHIVMWKRTLVFMLTAIVVYAFIVWVAINAHGACQSFGHGVKPDVEPEPQLGGWDVYCQTDPETYAEELLRELEVKDEVIPTPAITVEHDEEHGPVVGIDILKAFGNEEVKRAWSEAGEFRLRMPVDLVQAVVRTGYEPVKETGVFATQSPLHLLGTLGVALVGTRAAQGKLGDDIDDILDLFDSSDGDGDGFDSTPPLLSSLEASGPGSEIVVKDAAQSALNISATDGARVEVDFDLP